MNLKWINYNANPEFITSVWSAIKAYDSVKAMRKISDELVEILIDTLDDHAPLPITIYNADSSILISQNWAK